MNNEPNLNNSAFERRFFNWLQQKPVSQPSNSSGEKFNPTRDSESHSRVENLEWEELDPLDSEEIDVFYQNSQPSTLGDVPIVNNRFETVLKNRLKAEIQRNPPLFPWEVEQTEDAFSYPDAFVEQKVPFLSLWTAQKQHLKWSIPIPEAVFDQLLTPCQQVLQSSLREGAKLVRAVETLFPNQPQPLNELAGLVIRGGLRSPLESPGTSPQYDSATPEQQMVMLLLAAREIMSTLSLTCVLNQPPVEQRWLTAMGVLTVEAQYQERPQGTALRIMGQLPLGGQLHLQGQDVETTAQRSDQGYLCLELLNPKPHEMYQLNVQLNHSGSKPLSFAVYPTLDR